MPALQNFIHVRPGKATGIEAGALIGHGHHLIGKAHIQPALRIFFLSGRQVAAADLEQLLKFFHPGVAQIPGTDIGRCLLQGLDALLSPGISLFFNGTQGRAAQRAAVPGSFLAVAHQHRNHIVRKAQITVEAQQDLQLLGVQVLAQQPLDLAVQAAEISVAVHRGDHIVFRICRPFAGHEGSFLFLLPQAHLPQHCLRQGQLIGRHSQFRGRADAVAAAQVYVQKRRIAIADSKELLQFLIVQRYFLYSHSIPHKWSFGNIISQLSSRHNRTSRGFFAEKPMEILSHNSILCLPEFFAPILRGQNRFFQKFYCISRQILL